MRSWAARLARWAPPALGILGAVVAVFLWGYATHRYFLFPADYIIAASDTAGELKRRLSGEPPHFYHPTRQTRTVSVLQPQAMAPGVTLITGVGPDRTLFAKLVDAQGKALHSWDIDWWRMWPHPDHVPEGKRPHEPPGMDIQGAVLSPNGDLTFNFSDLGLMQVDFCGRVKWRAPHMTHHAVADDEKGNFWSLDVVMRDDEDPTLPNIKPQFRDVSVVEFSPDGKLLHSYNIYRLLQKNGLHGFMYLSSYEDESTAVTGDHFHTNDVDVFPSSMAPGEFAPGDVMVSVRNANLVFVFDPRTEKIKTVLAGRFVRQHDPDFVDGWTVSIFDNNNIGLPESQRGSKIVEYDFRTGQMKTLYAGGGTRTFYTAVMGNHQRLPNGNMLLTESQNGRVLEVNRSGDLVWDYNNLVGGGLVGDLTDAVRIPPDVLPAAKIHRLAAGCQNKRI